MANEVQVFDSDALKKRIAETVQGTFGMMIPPDAFNQLIEKHVKEFFENESYLDVIEVRTAPHTGYGYQNTPDTLKLRERMTPFKAMVYMECRKIAGEKLSSYFKQEGNAVQKAMEKAFEGNQEFTGAVSHNVAAIALKVRTAQETFAIKSAIEILGRVMSNVFNAGGAHDIASNLQSQLVNEIHNLK